MAAGPPRGIHVPHPEAWGRGFLERCPRTVPSIVYLRAGARPNVMHLYEVWIHTEAYGFRPCRRAIDDAGVTAVLLDRYSRAVMRLVSALIM